MTARARKLLLVLWGGALVGPTTGCREDVVTHGSLASCVCSEPTDECVEGRCVDRRDCPEVPCREHYTCIQTGSLGRQCVCDSLPQHWEHCAPRCMTDDDCEGGTFCRTPEGICVPTWRCLSGDACASGQTCALSPEDAAGPVTTRTQPVCGAPRQGAEPGASCEGDGECSSGICRGRCIESCRDNAACASSERCIDGLCLATEGACVSCRESEYLCLGTAAHCVESCSMGADCSATDCWLSRRSFHCGEGAKRCPDDAFFVAETPLGSAACLVHRPCWKDVDCEAQQTCVLMFDLATGYCGVSLGS